MSEYEKTITQLNNLTMQDSNRNSSKSKLLHVRYLPVFHFASFLRSNFIYIGLYVQEMRNANFIPYC